MGHTPGNADILENIIEASTHTQTMPRSLDEKAKAPPKILYLLLPDMCLSFYQHL